MTASPNPRVAKSVARTRPRGRLLIAAVAPFVLCCAWVTTAMNANAAAPSPTGWTQVFSDDFTGAAGSRVGGSWRYDVGTSYPGGPGPGFGTGEVETMTDSTANVALDGAGNLKITALRGGPTGWTSGRIETNRDDFQPPAGGTLRVEARLRLPDVSGAAGRGYWPAFWMLGAPYRGNWWNWPGVGEIDIMENVQGLNRVWGTMHCGTSPGGPCNEKSGLGNNVPCNGTSCQGGFHTYAIEWDRSTSPQQIRWYLDDVQFHTVNADQMDAGTWNAATDHGFFIILNLAMGGEFPAALGGGPDAASASGGSLLVDYVRVSTAGAGAPPPEQTTGPPSPPAQTTGPPSPPVSPPVTTAPPTGSKDAYNSTQAESYHDQGGVTTEPTTDTGGGQDITSIGNGDWVLYNGVNFGTSPARQFIARAASGAAGGISGLVEVRLDSRTSQPIGSFAIASTGGWQTWKTVPANIDAVTGTHDVYITFTSGQPEDYVNINWISFGH
jgi:beta-glucanase (GH16 family)